MKCQCANVGFCPTYKRNISEREHEICSETFLANPVSEDKCEKYRQLWLAQAEGRPVPQLPPLAEQVRTFAAALAKWQAAGRPRRTEEEMATLQAICEGCEMHMREEKKCGLCGCHLSSTTMTFLLQMADAPGKLQARTEKCPYVSDEFPNGKWPLELVTIADGD